MGYKIPTLGMPEGLNYVPVAIAGVLIVLFSIEHIIALVQRRGSGARHGTDHPFRRASWRCWCWACRSRSRSACPSVATILYAGLPVAVVFQQMVVRDEGVLVPRHPVLHLRRRADALRRHRRPDRRASPRAWSATCAAAWACSNVVACTLFGGVSGSPVADVSAMGAVMIPMMKKEGYDADYAVNVTTHAALVGALMPTSHNMIIYSLAAGRQGVDRRADPRRAGAGAGADDLQPRRGLRGRRQARLPAPAPSPAGTSSLHSLAAALPGLFVVVIILAGILSGVFTATESASVAVLYALLITVFVYRSLSWDDFLKAAARAVQDHRRRAAADRRVGRASAT